MRRIMLLLLVVWGCDDAASTGARLDIGQTTDGASDEGVGDTGQGGVDAATPIDGAQPDVALPDAALPDAAQDLGAKDAESVDVVEPDTALPDVAVPDVAEPDAFVDPCEPNPCDQPNQGICEVVGNDARCRCESGFVEFEGTCVEIVGCRPDDCNGRGTCFSDGPDVRCACDDGFVGDRCEGCDEAAGLRDDGAGGCTDDPCLPNPCAVNNEACRVADGMPLCFFPDCDDGDPCTEDQIVNGECVFPPVEDGTSCGADACDVDSVCTDGLCVLVPTDCDDDNVCTADLCDPVQGCTSAPTPETVPDDSVPCTVDRCTAEGAAIHEPQDIACDDELWCSGVELCRPWFPDADADGCVHVEIPTPPEPERACVQYGECRNETEDFERIEIDCPRLHCGAIEEDTVWTADELHVVTCDIYVQGDAAPTLTIEPGARVEFETGTAMFIGPVNDGRLVMRAGLTPTVFIGAETEAGPAEYRGLFLGERNGDSVVEGLQMTGGASPGLTANDRDFEGAIEVWGRAPSIGDITVESASGHGIAVFAGAPLMTAVQLLDNRDDGLFVGPEATLDAGLGESVFRGNGRHPVTLPVHAVHQLEAVAEFENNANERVQITAGVVRADRRWQRLDVDYLVAGGITVQDPSAPTLTLSPGVRLFMAGTALNVGAQEAGRLVVEGAETPVEMRSASADPQPGDWGRLGVFAGDTGSVLTGLRVSHGGGDGGDSGCIEVVGGQPTLDMVSATSCAGHGLYAIAQGSVRIARSRFAENVGDGLRIASNGRIAIDPEPSFIDNVMVGNGGHPISLPANFVAQLDASSSFAGNSSPLIRVTGGEVTVSGTWQLQDVDYFVEGGFNVVAVDVEDPPAVLEIADEVRLAMGPAARISVGAGRDGTLLTRPGVRIESAAAAPAAGDWDQILFAARNVDSVLTETQVRHAGDNNLGTLVALESEVRVVDSVIETGASWGIFGSTRSSFRISGTRIAGHNLGGIVGVANASFGDRTDPTPTFVNNVVTENGGPSADINGAVFHQLDASSTFVGNNPDVVQTGGGTMQYSVRWQNLGVPYHVTANVSIGSDQREPVLTIDPGVQLRFGATGGIEVSAGGPGGLVSRGTPEQPVMFGPLPADEPQWRGIRMFAGCVADSAVIEHTSVEFAGAGSQASIWILDCPSAVVRDSRVAFSFSDGIRLTRSAGATVERIDYEGNAGNDGPP